MRKYKETVGQYAREKDSLGNEIYEGDKIRIQAGAEYNGFHEHDYIVTIKDIREIFAIIESADVLTVIGNIHEADNENI